MSLKGTIKPDHIPVKNFKLLVIGLPELTVTKVAGIEVELNVVDLPDRTSASGGETNPVEFTMEMPTHHVEEQAAMEAWWLESQDPVSPLYKKNATLVVESISRNITVSYALSGLFPSKPKTPDLDMANDGEMSVVEWTMRADDFKRLPVT